jgi:hypothetical protein
MFSPQRDSLAAVRWLAMKNGSAEEVPAHAAVVVSSSGDNGEFTIAKPTVDGEKVWLAGPAPVLAGDYGTATNDYPAWAYYDSADGTPAVGETWGAGAGTWKLKKGMVGFRICGTPDATLGIVPVEAVDSGNETQDLHGYRHADDGTLSNYFPGGIITGNYVFNVAAAADKLHAVAFIVSRSLEIDRFAINVGTAAVAGSKARLAIYDTAPGGTDLWPRTRLLDTGEFTIDSTGAKIQTVSLELSAGLYWFCYLGNASAGIKGTYDVFMWPILGVSNALVQYMGLRFTYSYGAFPSSFPAKDPTYLAAGDFVIPYVRVAL